MIRRNAVILMCLVLVGACGGDESSSEPTAEVAGLWRPADEQTREHASGAGFLLLNADGTFEQFDGSVTSRGAFRLDGERLVFEPERRETAPTCTYALADGRLTLRVGEEARQRTLVFARGDAQEGLADAPARFQELRAALTAEIRTRVTRAAQARIAKLGLDEVFEISAVTKVDVERMLASLFIPWSASMPSGAERIEGQFVLQFTLAGADWRLLRVEMVIPEGPQASVKTLIRVGADGGVDVNPSVEIAAPFWDAWVHVLKKR